MNFQFLRLDLLPLITGTRFAMVVMSLPYRFVFSFERGMLVLSGLDQVRFRRVLNRRYLEASP